MELFKTIATYVIALVVILGGGALLVIPTQVPPEQLLPFLTGMVGGVVAYVFSERQTATVQKGNGLERSMLEAVHRRLDVELPQVTRAAAHPGDMTPDAEGPGGG